MNANSRKFALISLRLIGLLCVLLAPVGVFAQVSFEEAPINYNKAEPDNLITRFQKKLDQGQIKLAYDRKRETVI